MNNFHKPEDSVFNVGEIWYAAQGNYTVVIIGTSRFSEGIYDANVYYRGTKEWQTWVHDKDAWNFQVRYTHSSEQLK